MALVVKNLSPSIGDARQGFSPELEGSLGKGPTPVFLSGESYGQRILAGYRPWGHKESVTTEHEHTHAHAHRTLSIQIVS